MTVYADYEFASTKQWIPSLRISRGGQTLYHSEWGNSNPSQSYVLIVYSSSSQKAQPRAPDSQFLLPVNIAFYLVLLSHILAAAYAPIQDCDESFNYWEPLHYLSRGYGLQTWEYSPQYALRSWFYIAIHALPTKLLSFFARSKTFEFYVLRILLALCSAGTETRLFSAISRTLNPRIGIFYLMITALSPGTFYSSVAFLPSSFAMYMSNLGLAAFIDWRGGPRTAPGIMWFGIGALVGWPYSAILITPFLLEELVFASITGQGYETFRRFLDGTVRSLIVLVCNFPRLDNASSLILLGLSICC